MMVAGLGHSWLGYLFHVYSVNLCQWVYSLLHSGNSNCPYHIRPHGGAVSQRYHQSPLKFLIYDLPGSCYVCSVSDAFSSTYVSKSACKRVFSSASSKTWMETGMPWSRFQAHSGLMNKNGFPFECPHRLSCWRGHRWRVDRWLLFLCR